MHSNARSPVRLSSSQIYSSFRVALLIVFGLSLATVASGYEPAVVERTKKSTSNPLPVEESYTGRVTRTEKAKLHVAIADKNHTVDRSTLKGKIMCGYQGWFNTPGDGMGLGWKHWSRQRNRPFGPGNVSVDLWPDVSEFSPSELYETRFKHADGRAAQVYSGANPTTIMRHFSWMQEYGIDGIFLQRFANGLKQSKLLTNNDKVLSGVRKAAEKTERVYAIMYDLSGLKKGECVRVLEDWSLLEQQLDITSDRSYLHHNGKPLVAIWGVGFNDGRKYTLDECLQLVLHLKDKGCSVLVGAPTGWRKLDRDSVPDKQLHDLLKQADVICPWTVGRYQSIQGVLDHEEKQITPDIAWCKEQKIDYLPVVFPGFSWHNLKGAEIGQIPRLKGQFLWSQIVAAKRSGTEMIYVAMFDEVDEATAIFKCTNHPPVGQDVKFLTYEGLPSDHYLWLTGQGGRMLRGEIPPSMQLPER